jgi:hypothetical protein
MKKFIEKVAGGCVMRNSESSNPPTQLLAVSFVVDLPSAPAGPADAASGRATRACSGLESGLPKTGVGVSRTGGGFAEARSGHGEGPKRGSARTGAPFSKLSQAAEILIAAGVIVRAVHHFVGDHATLPPNC